MRGIVKRVIKSTELQKYKINDSRINREAYNTMF